MASRDVAHDAGVGVVVAIGSGCAQAAGVDELSVDANVGAGLDGGDHAAAGSMARANARPLRINWFRRSGGRPPDTRPRSGRTPDKAGFARVWTSRPNKCAALSAFPAERRTSTALVVLEFTSGRLSEINLSGLSAGCRATLDLN
jgi:hypothetical protein